MNPGPYSRTCDNLPAMLLVQIELALIALLLLSIRRQVKLSNWRLGEVAERLKKRFPTVDEQDEIDEAEDT